MLIYAKTDFTIWDKELFVKKGFVLNVDDALGKKIITSEYGHITEVIDLTEDEAIIKNPEVDLESLKMDDLRAMAKEKGIESYSSLKKEELIKALSE